MRSAFMQMGSVPFGMIRDGLSNTVVVSEILQGERNDQRGMIWLSLAGGDSFSSRFAPNQFKDFYGLESGVDYLNDLSLCTSQPYKDLPCASAAGSDPLRAFVGAKSRHPGGVNALFGDGSVRFIKETIDHPTWMALNSIMGGELIDSSNY
jgi:prepilin-type processing-associated H-X9-DG protein